MKSDKEFQLSCRLTLYPFSMSPKLTTARLHWDNISRSAFATSALPQSTSRAHNQVAEPCTPTVLQLEKNLKRQRDESSDHRELHLRRRKTNPHNLPPTPPMPPSRSPSLEYASSRVRADTHFESAAPESIPSPIPTSPSRHRELSPGTQMSCRDISPPATQASPPSYEALEQLTHTYDLPGAPPFEPDHVFWDALMSTYLPDLPGAPSSDPGRIFWEALMCTYLPLDLPGASSSDPDLSSDSSTS